MNFHGAEFDKITEVTKELQSFEEHDLSKATWAYLLKQQERDQLVTTLAKGLGCDAEDIYDAADAIAEKARWECIVDEATEAAGDQTDNSILDNGMTLAEFRSEMKKEGGAK